MTAALAPPPAGTTGAPTPAVQVLTFTEPVAGFPGHRDYALVPADASGALFWLQSLAVDGPRFLAVAAGTFFPDYAPVLPGSACVELGIGDARDATVYCLVSMPQGDAGGATANLRAPVVVSAAASRACQVVLTDAAHPIRRPLRR